ncbi:MAG: hypothetical protein ACRBCT_08220 [Alphaproteobacteria bacterium]
MLQLFSFVFIVAASVLMGVCVLVVLSVPELVAHDSSLILPAVGVGIVAAIPVSWVVARKMKNAFK